MIGWFHNRLKRGRRGVVEIAAVGGPALVLLVLGFVVAFNFVEPAPPKRIEIATGGIDGGYYAFASRYRKILARHGVELVLRQTSGSVENIRLLDDDSSGIQLALVQGGTAKPGTSQKLAALASLYREPVWVFHQRRTALARLTDLRGKRVAVGLEGSGTRALALRLLADNDLTGRVTLSPLSGSAAIASLRRGRVDTAFIIGSPRAPYVRTLLAASDIDVMNFARAEAYVRRHRYLSSVTVPMGMFDLARNIPPKDIKIIAPTASLVARRDLHPALIELIMGAVKEVHENGGMFERAGEFPSGRFLDLPINADAKRYLEFGSSFLQRYLPFWIANFLDRTKIMLVPLITLLVPLIRILPPTYRWRMRHRIIRWYRKLGQLERSLEQRDGADPGAVIAELDRIEKDVLGMRMPSGYLDAVYTLRLHIGHVRSRIHGTDSSSGGKQ